MDFTLIEKVREESTVDFSIIVSPFSIFPSSEMMVEFQRGTSCACVNKVQMMLASAEISMETEVALVNVFFSVEAF